ncbi:MAG: methyltransferase domain-containing protein [Anaerolineales bacterium]|nr:methyltransferase domain-containing protein [Anaerolineales bacterium]
MDVRAYNRKAWDREVAGGNPWTIPVSHEEIEAARRGEWQIVLTPSVPVPRDWFPALDGCRVLCLASGGGQQGPILAAAGAQVTVLDNSPRQLQRDRDVAAREGLPIETIDGDMRDLHMFPDDSFDLIIHPVSNLFVPDIQPVWEESFRVLHPGGSLLSGFNNPVRYMFDLELEEKERILQVKYALPYSDMESLDKNARQKLLDAGEPLEFSHTLDAQIGGQLQAGFVLTGFFEDIYPDMEEDLLSQYTPSFIATRAVKPG